MDIVRVLLVCTANICRSPMALAIGNHLAVSAGAAIRYEFDAAGTHAAAGGALPDPRTCKVLERAGYNVDMRRARRVRTRDLEGSDLVLAMDRGNLEELRRQCPPDHASKLGLLLDFAPGLEGTEIPDPYFGNVAGFERVLELCEAGVRGLLWSDRRHRA